MVYFFKVWDSSACTYAAFRTLLVKFVFLILEADNAILSLVVVLYGLERRLLTPFKKKLNRDTETDRDKQRQISYSWETAGSIAC